MESIKRILLESNPDKEGKKFKAVKDNIESFPEQEEDMITIVRNTLNMMGMNRIQLQAAKYNIKCENIEKPYSLLISDKLQCFIFGFYSDTVDLLKQQEENNKDNEDYLNFDAQIIASIFKNSMGL